ncbi:MAG TPA: hypothetical protein VFV89_11350 [Nocardioides sp.]|nr:hypothetical protein [Nocardioides sp.]HEX5088395.1 hypothetical protein [Nocardioides sp.]
MLFWSGVSAVLLVVCGLFGLAWWSSGRSRRGLRGSADHRC